MRTPEKWFLVYTAGITAVGLMIVAVFLATHPLDNKPLAADRPAERLLAQGSTR